MATSTKSTKVGSGSAKSTKGEKPKKEKKAKVKRTDFLKNANKDELDGNGKLKVVPAEWDGVLHNGLRKADFAEEFTFKTWKADQLESKIQKDQAKLLGLREEAETIKKFGDPKKRSQMKRAMRLTDQLSKLREQLMADGIDVDSLLSKSQA